MRASCLLFACLLGAATGLDETCWELHDNTYISCFAMKDGQESGTLEAMLAECKNLGSDCRGVTCNKDQTQCSSRFHLGADCTDHHFLKESTSEEKTYVKTCELNKFDFTPLSPNTYIGCSVGDAHPVLGSLLERKIDCAERGTGCFGVTCFGDPATSVNCSIREAGTCETQVKQDGAFSYTMTAKDSTPPADCTWESHEYSKFNCDVDPAGRQTLSLDDAKTKCETMRKTAKGTETFCNGVQCTGRGTPEDPLKCLTHTHCVAPHETVLTDHQGTSTFLPKCSTSHGAVCNSPCYFLKEFHHSACESDCDCEALRTCSANGYCMDPDVDPAQEACREGDDCVFEKEELRYISCFVGDNHDELEMDEAKALCKRIGSDCVGLTCSRETNKCTVRNHMACANGKFLRRSKTEDSYVKCCGETSHLYCRDAYSSGGSSGGAAWVLLVIVLLAVVAFLIYKNRVMAKQFIAPDKFNELPQDDEAPENWVIDDEADEGDDDRIN
eukprot:TRINITY_DN4447_c1_g1_i1.p1 TRINITY_DN4447_c1_g1~~TRINITY_DN4447_c1_g1_i1.p1  ORF type:complete len:500 (+),score=200.63 TRINITY_DN4447_c1_g1_i1:69-1568(+)